jgi:protein-disulfide isomerase
MPKSLACLLPLALALTACASARFTPSPHYASVTKHLDVGGDVLLYADVDGDLSAGAAYLDRVLDRVRKTYPDLQLDRINAKRILTQLGLDQILAMGLSSGREGKVFHNKSFFAYGKERRGILLLTGSPPRALEIGRQAPADVDVAFESDVKLKSLLDLAETIAKDVGGKEGRDLFAGLEEKLPGTSVSLRQLVGHLDTRLIGVLRLDYQRAFVLPGDEKITVPGFDLLLAADDLALLFDAYQGLFQLMPNVKTGSEGDLQWVEIEVGLPGAAWLRPVLVKNAKSGRLFLASSRDFVKEYLAAKSGNRPALAQAADFKRATGDFLPEANALTYVSGAFMPKVARFLKPLGKDDAKVQAGIDLTLELLPEGGIPFAAQQVHLPDGLCYRSYATTSHKSTLFPALVAGPMTMVGALAAVATSGFSKYLRASRETRPSAELAPQDKGRADDQDDDDDHGLGGDAYALGGVDRFRIPLGGPSRGAVMPLVSIVEFSDFQCPFCAQVNPTLQQVLDKYPKDVRIYFRHNPLPFHTDAALAAQAAQAAEAQGKFWPMHDALFANQKDLKRADLEAYAKRVGLDLARFKSALDQATYKPAVADDAALATKCGASGTPSFFINGRPLGGAQPLDKFTAMIDEEIAKAKRLLADGTRRQDVYTKLMATAAEPKPYQPPPSQPPALSNEVYKVPLGQAPARGGRAPKVTMVEYADFQCPFCARARATLDELATIYGDDLRLLYKHNPLSFHVRAKAAALAAEAAGAQGKFWAMHDKLFANQQALADADLERYAEEIGLDMAKYRAAMRKSQKLRRRIEADQDEAARFGVTGVPNFFVNGRPLRGAQPIETFKELIDQEIAKADAKLRKGTARKRLYAELTKQGLRRAPQPKPGPGEPDPETVYRAEIDGAPVRGAKDALVTIVLFSDYQCPFCRRVEPTLDKVLAEYKGHVRVVWRDMPLSFHARARDAAIAARAAGAQGKYWQMHDRILGGEADAPVKLEAEDLLHYAEELGLDTTAFRVAIQSEALAQAVDADVARAKQLGVSGTPACFINGKLLSGAQPYAAFKQRIDDELRAARKLVRKGTPRAKVYAAIMKGAKAEVDKEP